jgi:hypothetical protein
MGFGCWEIGGNAERRPGARGSHRTHPWREMDSNHRYRIRNNPFWLPPFGPCNSPFATKNGSFVPGTDGSNPSPSSAESSANLTFGENPTSLPSASRPESKSGDFSARCTTGG